MGTILNQILRQSQHMDGTHAHGKMVRQAEKSKPCRPASTQHRSGVCRSHGDVFLQILNAMREEI